MTQFSKEQQIAFDKYIQLENIFITGPGGSGKSELIRSIYQDAIGKNKNIHVCALTGCAAVLLNCKAKTIHSWAGIGLGRGETMSYIKKIRKNNYFTTLWKTTDILVVDEVSMLSFTLFNMLNTIGKHIRNCHSKPFGGIQVIFSGDFYQLPPVGNKEDPDSMRFCFESEEWSQVFPVANQIQLITIFRQSDPVYSSILNQIREGKMKRSSVNILEQYVGRKTESGTIIQPTKIYPTKYLVETMNQQNMTRLETEEKEYQAKQLSQLDCEDKGENKSGDKKKIFTETDIQHELDYLASNLICDQVLKLKIGAQVMCIVNMKMNDELLLCNGSQGIVTKFCPITGMPIVKYKNGLEISMNRHTWVSEKIPGIGISQIPLILAWALTIHKSQGSTLDAAEINVGSDIFECGQTYVALSRVKSLDGLYLTSFNYSKIKINKKVKEFYESLSKD
jgi:ATP-dependent DNA helicase PIF1